MRRGITDVSNLIDLAFGYRGGVCVLCFRVYGWPIIDAFADLVPGLRVSLVLLF